MKSAALALALLTCGLTAHAMTTTPTPNVSKPDAQDSARSKPTPAPAAATPNPANAKPASATAPAAKPAASAPAAKSAAASSPAASAPASTAKPSAAVAPAPSVAPTNSLPTVKPAPITPAPTIAPTPNVAPTPAPSATVAPVAPTVAPVTPVNPVVVEKGMCLAKRYKISNRPFNREEARYFLTVLGMKDVGRPDSNAVNWIFHDHQGSKLTYEQGVSEIAFGNDSIHELSPKDFVADSLIRGKTDALLRSILKEKSDRYVFANYEITMMQKKEPDQKDVQPAVPAYYFGRYLRKLDERVVLGDAFQIRLSYGADGGISTFSFRDPVTTDAGAVKAPTKEAVQDSLKRWTQSKTRPKAMYYPFHPDHLKIKSIVPVKVFDSYVVSTQKFRDTPQMDGAYLVPVVTVLAQVTVIPSKKKGTLPPPAEPVYLHYHFPCTPDAGLCWPDGLPDAVPPTTK